MARSALDEMSATGAFVRTPSTFRNIISRDPNSPFPAESGRYHLYISYACPWASRCVAYLKIKGLDKAISFTVSAKTESSARSQCFLCLFRVLENVFSLVISRLTQYGRGQRKLMTTGDGFFRLQVLRNQVLSLISWMGQKLLENCMRLPAQTTLGNLPFLYVCFSIRWESFDFYSGFYGIWIYI